jgi:hypothetical protein
MDAQTIAVVVLIALFIGALVAMNIYIHKPDKTESKEKLDKPE